MPLTTSLNKKKTILAVVAILGCLWFPVLLHASQSGTIAVLPPHNLSGKQAPVAEIREAFKQGLLAGGASLTADENLERFMGRHRIRYTNGLDVAIARAFQEEAGIDAVFIISVEQYDTAVPPRIGLTARLISTGKVPGILWTDTVAISGDDSLGLFGVGMTEDPKKLQTKAIDRLLASFKRSGGKEGEKDRKITRPKVLYRSPVLDRDLRENFVFFPEQQANGHEGKTPVRLFVALNAVANRPVAVDYVFRGSAFEDVDFRAKKGTLTFQPGETLLPIDISIVDNKRHDQNRTIEVHLVKPRNALLGSPNVHTYTIIDDDPEPTVSFGMDDFRVDENSGLVRIPVKLSAISGNDVVVPFSTRGTADLRNYRVSPGPAVIKAGQLGTEITVQPVANNLHEDHKTVVLAMGIPQHAAPGSATTATVLIRNIDPEPVVSFLSPDSRSEDNAGPARLEVALSEASGKSVSVEYGVTGGTAVTGSDFSLAGHRITFQPGETKKTIDIEIRYNGLYNSDRTIELSLLNPVHAKLGTKAVHTRTIVNTAPKPLVSFLYAASGGDEKRPGHVDIVLSAPSGAQTGVEYFVAGGSAAPGINYSATGGVLQFEPGETIKTIPIAVLHDRMDTDDRTIELGLKNPRNAVLGAPAVHTYTILDNDPEPIVSFGMAELEVQENGQAVAVAVELSAVSGRDVIVPFAVHSTAEAHDFTVSPGPVVIKAGELSTAIMVKPVANGMHEDNKTVVLTMGMPQHATPGKTATATVSIVNSDPEPTIAFVQSTAQSAENASPARIEVGLSRASGKPASVEYRVTGGTAKKGRDFSTAGEVITFQPGETKKTIEIEIRNNGVYNGDRTMELSLLNPSHCRLGEAVLHTHTIVNSSPMPRVSFVTAGRAIGKSDRTTEVTIQMSGISDEDTVVGLAVRGNAVDAGDFTVTPNPVIIKAGLQSESVVVARNDAQQDIGNDEHQTIELKLASVENASVGTASVYRLAVVGESAPTIAIIPFQNKSETKNAGDIVAQYFMSELFRNSRFSVLEPGVVRQQLLKGRMIMPEGISMLDAELIFNILESDLILTGKVLEYQAGDPTIKFDVEVYERKSRKMVWSSRSFNRGSDGVFFFDLNKVNNVEALASQMVRSVVRSIME